MATSLNMSLDDMLKRGKNERARTGARSGRGRGRGSGPGRFLNGERATWAVRRDPLAVNARPSAFSISKPSRRIRSLPWQHDLYEDGLRAAGVSGIDVGATISVFNLDKGVTNEDIRDLFSEFGEMKRFAIHYDKNGIPSGSAEVVYLRRSDAFQAVKRYNNVLLDGKPMKVEFVGATSGVPLSARVSVTGVNGRTTRTVVMTPGVGQVRARPPINRAPFQNRRGSMMSFRGRARGEGRDRTHGQNRDITRVQGHGGARSQGRAGASSQARGGARNLARGGTRNQGRWEWKKKGAGKSATDLDKELDNYHAEAMNTS